MPTCGTCGRESPEEFAFCPSCGTPISPASPRDVRKTVTVLFCDVVGSTAMGEVLDPESMRRVMARYFEAMRGEIERHGGTVEKFIGDAVMAVFGVPTLHEDDALRAVRAAVDMREELRRLNKDLERDHGVGIANRIGINTGEVVTEDVAAAERMVTGDAVNVAARLEQAAGPNEILMSDPTHRLVRDAVEATSSTPIEAKGKSVPLEAWRVIVVTEGAEGVSRRKDAPLVGRRSELRILADAFDRSRRERSCILVTILGVAGVGKSRLVDEVLNELSDAIVLRGRCLPYGEGITFWPVIEMLQAAAGLSGVDAPDEARLKLRSLLGDVRDQEAIEDRLGQVLGFAGAEAMPEETFWAVRKLFEAMGRDRPLVVDIDDLQWAEPTLLDLVEHVADWSRDAGILLLCSARPELLDERAQWSGGKMNAITFLLEPLDDEETAEIVGNLLDGSVLPAPILDRIEAAAEGNPLFVEQMVAMLIDQGALARTQAGWELKDQPETLAVPPTIQALLAARLERLSPAERDVIERASIEGKVFHRGGVLALCSEDLRPSVDRHLGALLRRDLIRPEPALISSEDAFRFRHMLIRDAAYAGLAKQTRADLHERFGGWLEAAAGERLELDEIIAYHLECAYGLRTELGPMDETTRAAGERAASLLIAAGDRAADRGDITGAATLWRRAVRLLADDDPRMPATAAAAAVALTYVGIASDSKDVVQGALLRVRAARSAQGAAGLVVLLARILCANDPSGNPQERIIELHEIAEREITSTVHRRLLGWARHSAAIGNVWLGHMRRATALCEQILSDETMTGDRYLSRVASDWALVARLWGPTEVKDALLSAPRDMERSTLAAIEVSVLLALDDQVDAARETYRQALARAEELGQAVERWKHWPAVVELIGDRPDVAEPMLRDGYDYLMGSGQLGPAASAAGYVARAMQANGHGEDALPLLAEHADTPVDDYEAIGLQRAAHSMILADLGEIDRAESLARQGVAALEPTEDLIRHGETLMALAYVLRAGGREEEAVAAARHALSLFERKGDIPDARHSRNFLGSG